MKILFIAPSNSVHAIRWIERSYGSGFTVDLYDLVAGASKPESITLNNYFAQNDELSFFQKLPILGQLIQVVSEYKYLKSAIRISKPDIIHAHWLFHSAPFVATFLAKKIPLISTPWGSDIQFPNRPLKGRLKKIIVNRIFIRRIAKNSTKFCCDSNVLADILERFGAEKSDIEIIYFGTDIEKFSSRNRDVELRTKFGAVFENDLLIISNRSHEPVYDLPTLFFAARELRFEFPELKYVVAGSGSLTDSLKILAKELEISDIVFFTGRLNDAEFVSATASCDLYVSTSTSDGGLAASTAEAMACEVPVIITNFGENSLWVDGKSTGLLFEIGDVNGLTASIKLLARNQELRSTLAKNGRAKIIADNNSIREWDKVINMYRGCFHNTHE